MLTIELKPELENTLKTMAEQQHSSISDIINKLLDDSLKENCLSNEQASIYLNQEQHFIDSLLNPKPANDKLKQSSLIHQEKKEHLPETQQFIGALKNTDSYTIEEDNTEEILDLLRKVKPVKCQYSSEQIIRSLRDGTILE